MAFIEISVVKHTFILRVDRKYPNKNDDHYEFKSLVEQISLIDEHTRTVYFRMYSAAHSYAILEPRSCSVTLKSRSLVNGSHSLQS